jgi:calcineurin-like phosphoesterase family protein
MHDKWVLNMFESVSFQKTDIVWILGDVGNYRNLEPLRDIDCKLRLVYGDRDGCHPWNIDDTNTHQDYHYENKRYTMFDVVVPFAPVKAGGKHCVMSHTPYDWDSDVDVKKFGRFTQFRLRDEGRILIHGHTRKPDVTTWSWNGTPQFNVAPDAWAGCLVPLEEIAKFAESQVW